MKKVPELNISAQDETPMIANFSGIDMSEVINLLDNSNLEERRDDQGQGVGTINQDQLSPIVCKSPQPRNLFFDEKSTLSLSPVLVDNKI
jgi:hypothetical protein